MASETTLGALRAGTIFGGDFRVVRLIGEGGMGAVYEVVQQSTSAPRALKLMQRELTADPTMRGRFEQEAKISARIDSDHVAQVVAAGVDAETAIPWIAMELLRGVSLDRYLSLRGALSPGEVRFLFEQLCHALGAAHAERIVHRDLKPANVFLSAPRVVGLAYVVKVLDLGIAKVLAEARTTKTAAVGTPMYMAPEQYQAGKVVPATDVWALGLIAFELLTGRSYWKSASGSDATPASIMYETCMGELLPASERAAELGLGELLPDRFDRWFRRCVTREPQERFADASEAFEALADLLGPAEPPEQSVTTLIAKADAGVTVARGPADLDPSGTEAQEPVLPSDAGSGTKPQGPARATRDREPARTERRVDGATVSATEPGGGVLRTGSPLARTLRGSEAGDAATRRRRFGAAAIIGVLAIAALLYGPSLRPTTELDRLDAGLASLTDELDPTTLVPAGRLVARGTVLVEGRSAHRALPPHQRVHTHVLLEVTGKDAEPASHDSVHLSLVIDRSGSMRAERIANAKAAAATAIRRLRDGDMVSVTAFDTATYTVVAPTLLGRDNREGIIAAVEEIALGGDTCISCGLDAARTHLEASPGWLGRILLLSDGDANAGVRDVGGFREIGERFQRRDVSVSSIGVGLAYNERILSALSRASNGRHYFADDESKLPEIFDAETKALSAVVASETHARLELADGVELVRVLDRASRTAGRSVTVPLGQLSRGEVKTVLVEVAMAPKPEGRTPLCAVELEYRDHLGRGQATVGGRLDVEVQEGADLADRDPMVEVRIQRSGTSTALARSNELFRQGQAKQALALLDRQAASLEQQRQSWTRRNVAPTPRGDADLATQTKAVDSTRQEYREALRDTSPTAAPKKPAAQRARRQSIEFADAFAY